MKVREKDLLSAYFCSTPYQIITAIALQHMLQEEADIYIIPLFSAASKYAENIKKLDVFRNVKLVEDEDIERNKNLKSKFLIHLRGAYKYLRVDKIVEEILIDKSRYNKIYASSKSFIPRMVYFYCIKHKINSELIYFDDGEGSYDFKLRIEPSLADKIIRYFLFGKRSIENNHKMYLYDPDLYKEINGCICGERIYPISHDFTTERFKKIMSIVFEIENKDLISEKAILIDMIKEVKYGDDEVKRINKTYSEISKMFAKDGIVIKRHPRDTSKYSLEMKCYKNDSIPFECLCTQIDMDKKVLIGLYSTALIIPKMLLDQEPTVILLYRLFKRKNQTEADRKKQDKFYDSCKNRYASKNKFFIPETFDELTEALLYSSKN